MMSKIFQHASDLKRAFNNSPYFSHLHRLRDLTHHVNHENFEWDSKTEVSKRIMNFMFEKRTPSSLARKIHYYEGLLKNKC